MPIPEGSQDALPAQHDLILAEPWQVPVEVCHLGLEPLPGHPEPGIGMILADGHLDAPVGLPPAGDTLGIQPLEDGLLGLRRGIGRIRQLLEDDLHVGAAGGQQAEGERGEQFHDNTCRR